MYSVPYFNKSRIGKNGESTISTMYQEEDGKIVAPVFHLQKIAYLCDAKMNNH